MYSKESDDFKKSIPETQEQIDPATYLRSKNNMFPYGIPGQNPYYPNGQFPGGIGYPGTVPINPYNPNPNGISSIQNGPMISFNCKCFAKGFNTMIQMPAGIDQSIQQQIMQLQEQVRRQQEIINKVNQQHSSFEQFVNLLTLAQSLDCTCSDLPRGDVMTGVNPYAPNGLTGMTGVNSGLQPGLSGLSNTGIHQEGVPIITIDENIKPMQPFPFEKR
ncbi:hypothetical protein WR25_20388 [Diploscapter pachys]|uniref:Uncharacterized protein n=1 Tax=Diploscapter pachys TaxID=2018661 RepID=A0A2A2KQA7_9BILA|nr:hypothetical protein WR25_20388 [Diploscapter pachys]